MARPRLAGLLWSDRSEAQAQSSLRQALAGLRRDLATINLPLFSIGNGKVAIDPTIANIDAVEFRRLAVADDVAALRRAASLYRGQLLADTFIRDPAFEDWLVPERQRLADLASTVLERLYNHETGRARIGVAQLLLTLDPLREASHRMLMLAYFEAGETGLALRQYDICRHTLRTELQVVPGEETEALRRQILAKAPGQPDGHGGQTRSSAQVEAEPRTNGKPLVAVLPFEVIGGDKKIKGFSDGLTEDVVTGLSRISAIRVVARNTMLAYGRTAADVRTVARDLAARYVLEGSVRTSAGRIRVSAQLIDAVSGHHIWADMIDRLYAEGFESQDDITRSIVASIQTRIILYEGRVSAAQTQRQRVTWLLARSWQRFHGLNEESLAESRALGQARA